jgi:hypothetical protein
MYSLALIIFVVSEKKAFEHFPIGSNVNLCIAVAANTSPSDQRSFLLKETSTLQKMSPDSTDIEAENDIKRYSNRPRALENWCLADYVSQLDIKYPKKKLGDTANFKDSIDKNNLPCCFSKWNLNCKINSLLSTCFNGIGEIISYVSYLSFQI